MTVCYKTDDNRYVQYRYKLEYKNTTAGNAAFVNPANWQGVDDEPAVDSDNLVKSGGVKFEIDNIETKISREVTENYPIVPEVTEVSTLISSSTKFATNQNFKTYYLRVIKGDVVKVTTNYSFYVAFSTKIPANNVPCTDRQFYNIVASDEPINVTKDGYFGLSIDNNKTASFKIVNGSGLGVQVKELEGTVGGLQTTVGGLQTTVGSNNNNITGLDRQVFCDVDYIIPSSDLVVDNLCATNGSFGENNSWHTFYFSVLRGDIIRITANYSFRYAYVDSSNIPAKNILNVGYTDVQTIYTDEPITALYDGYFCISISKTKTVSYKIEIGNTLVKRVKALEEAEPEPQPSLESKIITPIKLYELYPNPAFNAPNRLYIEGLLNDWVIPHPRINGQMSVIATSEMSNNTKEYNFPVVITADGYADYSLNVPIQREQPTVAQNQLIKIQCIGDSLTINGYPSIVKYIFERLNDEYDNISAVMLGREFVEKEVSYNGITKTCRGCCDAMGGFSICDYLRHRWGVRGGSPSASNNSRHITQGKVSWDLLGLGTKTRNGVPQQSYVTYTGVYE